MSSYTYDEFRRVLEQLGFDLVRRKGHETWRRVVGNVVYRVTLSHQHGRDIPRPLYRKMLRQAGITDEDEFVKILHGR